MVCTSHATHGVRALCTSHATHGVRALSTSHATHGVRALSMGNMLCATWYEGTAQLFSLAELKLHLFKLYVIG